MIDKRIINNVFFIILAAGKGKRMNSTISKCATVINGKPFVRHIVDTVKKITNKNIIVVVGYRKESIINILGSEVKYAYQNCQLGTADAVKCALEFIPQGSICVVIPGDMPLITDNIINELVYKHITEKNELTFITTILEKEMYYGKVIRKDNKILIREYKELNEEEKKVKEVNVGVYCFDSDCLIEKIEFIENNNNQKEFYLTDIVRIISKDGKVNTMAVENSKSIISINDQETLKLLE